MGNQKDIFGILEWNVENRNSFSVNKQKKKNAKYKKRKKRKLHSKWVLKVISTIKKAHDRISICLEHSLSLIILLCYKRRGFFNICWSLKKATAETQEKLKFCFFLLITYHHWNDVWIIIFGIRVEKDFTQSNKKKTGN